MQRSAEQLDAYRRQQFCLQHLSTVGRRTPLQLCRLDSPRHCQQSVELTHSSVYTLRPTYIYISSFATYSAAEP